VIQCRIERARHLLLDPTLTIAQVAQRVGFADQSHLHRHLKRSLGITPGDLRGEGKREEESPKRPEEYSMQESLKPLQ
jgi:AraC family transcriptional regulator